MRARNNITFFASLMAVICIWGGVPLRASEIGAAVEKKSGFVAQVSGARKATVSGPGIYFRIPASESPVMKRPEYLVVADNSGVRENGITFVIPHGTSPGTYQLVSAHPFDIGKKFEVRVELGSTTDYFNKNTSGTITIISLPDKGDPGRVQGKFEFEVSNSKGERAKVKGRFDFLAEPK